MGQLTCYTTFQQEPTDGLRMGSCHWYCLISRAPVHPFPPYAPCSMFRPNWRFDVGPWFDGNKSPAGASGTIPNLHPLVAILLYANGRPHVVWQLPSNRRAAL